MRQATEVRPRLAMLGAADLEYIHAQTLRLLGEVGVRVGSRRALGLLEQAGAAVDGETMVVRIPADLVESAIAAAPKTVLLAARDPEKDALLDKSRPYATNDGMGSFTLDYRTGVRRPSTAKDLTEALTVTDALDELGICWYTAHPTEEQPKLEGLRGLATMLTASAKHSQGEILDPLDVPYVMEILAAANGDGRWHEDRPLFSIVYCPVSPLQHDGPSLEAAMLLAAQGVPITVYSLALAGATAPLTLAGTMVQTNAEILSGITVLQLAAPGCPIIYVGNAGIMDMRSCTFATCGPEQLLFNTGLTELGHSYGFPVLSGGFSSDHKELSMQSGAEGMSMALLSALVGADLITGMGMLDAANMLFLPKLVLDAELMRQCRRVAGGFGLDDDHVLFDLIEKTGPGGHYLGARETRAMMRAGEHYVPGMFLRGSYDTWKADPVAEATRAAAAVDEILATHKVKPLPDGAAERIEEVIAAAAAELPER